MTTLTKELQVTVEVLYCDAIDCDKGANCGGSLL